MSSRSEHKGLLGCLLKVIETLGLALVHASEHAVLRSAPSDAAKGAHACAATLSELLHDVRFEGHLSTLRRLRIYSPAWLVMIGKLLLLIVVVINLGQRLRLHVIVYLIVSTVVGAIRAKEEIRADGSAFIVLKGIL